MTNEDNPIPTLGETAADAVSKFGGSWTFILIFFLFVGSWITINLVIHTFDPFPFILLNLVLGCLTVFQAPFILMSQNRLSAIDRTRAQEDYEIDLHNEAEIQALHRKIDQILLKLPKD